MIDCPMSLGVY